MLSILIRFVPYESKPSVEQLCISRKVFVILCRLLTYLVRQFSASKRVELVNYFVLFDFYLSIMANRKNLEQQQLRGNRVRMKWTEDMNNFLLDCKSKAQALAKSNNPPRFENGRKKGYMRIMKELWDDSLFGHVDLTSQNLRDQAVRLEKTM